MKPSLYIDPSGVLFARIDGQDYECADQERARQILGYPDTCVSINGKFQVQLNVIPKSIHPLPDNYSVEVKESCASDCCPIDAGCEHCKEPKKLAYLIPVPSKERRKELLIEMMKEDEKNGMYEPVESREENERLMDELLTEYRQMRQRKATAFSTRLYLCDKFTITRRKP